jgi:hypothetical protein
VKKFARTFEAPSLVEQRGCEGGGGWGWEEGGGFVKARVFGGRSGEWEVGDRVGGWG